MTETTETTEMPPIEGLSTPLLEVADEVEVTVPSTVSAAEHDFWAEAGEVYLAAFDIHAEKPEGSPGAAMYFAVGLVCGEPSGGTLANVGGTQNLRTGELVTIQNRQILRIEETGNHSCRISLSSPNEEAAALGATAGVHVEWDISEVFGEVIEAPTGQTLPAIVGSGESSAAMGLAIDSPDHSSSSVDVMGTIHVTTCTGENGSKEAGRTWCLGDSTDPDGSERDAYLSVKNVDASGHTCSSQRIPILQQTLERWTHQLVITERVSVDVSECGERVDVEILVDNAGPAALVIHE